MLGNFVLTALLAGATMAQAASRTITVDNQCKGTIWPAFAGPAATRTTGGKQPFGWAQPPGTTTFTVPDPWVSTRLWARTGCNADGSGCKIGFCASNKVECNGEEYGGQGATLAEFTINSTAKEGDFYDISAVDGYNLPMKIEAIGGKGPGGCETATCGVDQDILMQCDPRLIFPPGSANIWSCGTPCLVGYELSSTFDPNNSEWCCQKGGVAIPQDTCTSSMIPFYKTYKNMCKNAYVFAQDDRHTAVFACHEPNYKITFCPGGKGAGVNPPLAQAAVKQNPGNSAGFDGGTPSYIRLQPAITETWKGGPTARSANKRRLEEATA